MSSIVNPVQPPRSNLSPARLLIVEDDPVMRLGLSELFEDNPQFAIVGQVADGYSAIDLTLRLQPNNIIMDIIRLIWQTSGYGLVSLSSSSNHLMGGQHY